MAKTAKKSRNTGRTRETKENPADEDEDERDGARGDRDNQDSGKSDFVNITKLFETKRNQDILVGTCKPEYLGKLQDLLEEGADTGVAFFVNLNGKWGPNLSATLGRDQKASGGRGRGESRSGRSSFNDRSDERGARRRPRF